MLTASEYREITLAMIITEGQSVRVAQDDDHVVELAMSIARHGLLEPIIVRQNDSGTFQLVAGFHRLAAAHRLGWIHIPAHILPNNGAPLKSLALVENIVRRDMTLSEECQAVHQLHVVEGLSPSQLCDLLGKGRAWVDRRIMAPNLPEKVREALFDGMITLGVAEEVSKVEDEGIRNQILNQAIYAKLTLSSVRDVVKLYLEAPSIQGAVETGVKTAQEVHTSTPPSRHCEACQDVRPYTELKPIFICKDGCESLKRAAEEEDHARTHK